MYSGLARIVARHPWRVIAFWIVVVALTVTVAFWGFGTPLYSRLHSDLPQSQASESYRGNALIEREQPEAYAVIAAISGLTLGADHAAAREARATLDEATSRAEEAKARAETLGAEARAEGEKAADPRLDPAARAAASARARELADEAAQAGVEAADAGRDAEEAGEVDLSRATALADALGHTLDEIAHMPGVTSVAAPFYPERAMLSTETDDLLNEAGTKAAIVVMMNVDDGDGEINEDGEARINDVVAALRDLSAPLADAAPGASLSVFHQRAIEASAISQLRADLVVSEGVGIPLSILIMVYVFGGVLVALMPAAGAVVAIGGALAVMLAMTYLADQQSFSLNVISVLGLGLSIDYGLLLLSRYREELTSAHPRLAAADPSGRRAIYVGCLEVTLASAGRTVAFSSITVAIAIIGMMTFEPDLLRSLAIAGVTVVMLAAVCALTLVPALAFLTSRFLARPPRSRLGRFFSHTTPPELTWWYRLGRVVNARPWPFLIASVALLAVCLIPLGHLQLRNSMIELLAPDNPQKIVVEDFEDVPAVAMPAIQVVAETTDTDVLGRWGAQIATWDGVDAVSSPIPLGDEATRITIDVAGSDRGSPKAEEIVAALRADRPEGVTTYVTGQAAQQHDFVAALARGLPWSLAIIVCATLVLLFAMTRSIIVPIKALFINAFSLAAAMGISTWVFQDGHGIGLLGARQVGGLESYVVVMMVCIGFGLSMDYEVFLLARMRETYVATWDNDRGVVMGLAHSGRIITSAAGILVGVFLAFCLSKMALLKQVGFVMAVTVGLDASVVRLFLVPSLMTLFGDFNWWAPRWMRRRSRSEKLLASRRDV